VKLYADRLLRHVTDGASATFGRLTHLRVSTGLQKAALITFVVVGTFFIATQAFKNPRGMIRRLAAGYVAKLDAQQRWMFRPETGAKTAWMQAAAVLAILLVYGLRPIGALLALAALVVIVPPVLVSRAVAARRARIDEQAHGFALALANALKATASIGDALKSATDVTAKPLQDELKTTLRQVHVGSTLEEALLALSTRVQASALDVVVSALLIGRQTGGDLPRILESTAASLRELKRLEKHTDKVTRSAKQSLGVSAVVTLGLAVALPQLFPGFLEPLRNTVKGQLYAAQMAFVYLFALYLGYRFTRKSI
jgi:tight adherence protein B